MKDDRWEYRIWPKASAEAVTRVTSLFGAQVRSAYRTDHYFLTPAESLLPKIRGGKVFELKELLETRSGCEHWMKAVSNEVTQSRSLDGLLGEAKTSEAGEALLKAAVESLSIIEVRKHRRQFVVGSAEIEATSIMVGGQTLETLAVETPDFEECRELAEKLGFAEHENADYGSVLRALR